MLFGTQFYQKRNQKSRINKITRLITFSIKKILFATPKVDK